MEGSAALPTVSVIVPIYNVEPYVTQCLDSLVLQELAAIEIIVVNDGSTDESARIASRFAESHANLRVIHQRNQGLSAARNTGIAAARGEFIGFVDGDDWVHPRMYQEMSSAAIAMNADLVISNGFLYDDQTRGVTPIQDFRVWESFRGKNTSTVLDPQAEPDLFILDTSACKRLYRRAFLDGINFSFTDGKVFGDVATHYKLLMNTNRVALLDRRFYYYRTNRPKRITAKKDVSLFQVFDLMEEVIADLEAGRAGDLIWANYIWFQNWVLRWLRTQIDAAHSPAFDARCVAISGHFPPSAVRLFNEKFKDDWNAPQFVQQQISNELERLNPAVGGGSDSETLHLGNDPIGFFNPDPNTFTPDIWGWICCEFDIRSVLDIGCGIGTNLTWFKEYGFEILGVEGHPRAIRASLIPGDVVQHDFSKGSWTPNRVFDLCVCTEFAEHVEAQFEPNWMAATEKCSYLLLSAAPPGQGGYHHVNEQPDSYWIARFESRGFRHRDDITKRMRASCSRKKADWGRNTLMFFDRVAPVPR